MRSVNVLAMCTALCAIGCEPKLLLQLERHGAEEVPHLLRVRGL